MAKFAPVAPIRILEQFSKQHILGEYHLLLAHDIVASELNRAAYHEVFGQRKWDGTVILDNSVIELGTAVDLDEIATAAEACRANVIVLPDVLENGDATVDSITDAYGEWASRFDDVLGIDNYLFMIVPQGKTIEQFTECARVLYDFMEEYEQRIMWGIPRNLVKLHGTRKLGINAIQEIDDMAHPFPIHLLGFSDNIADDIACAKIAGVGGIDSAVPIRTQEWPKIVSGELVAPPRGDWWETTSYRNWMFNNLEHARETFDSGQSLDK